MPGRIVLLFCMLVLLGLVTAVLGHYLLRAHPSLGEALWQALTHMIDPGSLADDHAAGERAIGVTQVLIGIVFLAGVVLTVLTEVADRTLLRLSKGDPALAVHGHLLLVGMNGTLRGVTTLLSASDLDPHPPIVVMLSPERADDRQSAHRALSGYPGKARVVVADPLTDGFDRVCAGAARHVVLLSPDLEPDRADLAVTTLADRLASHLDTVDRHPSVAVELRRGRNADALWFGADGVTGRFPANFDALVNDRNIGMLLALVVLNPHFAGTFLPQDEEMTGVELLPAGDLAGVEFGTATDRLQGATLLGVLSGSGTAASAEYLPSPQRRIEPGERLIVVRDDSPGDAGHEFRDPDSVKVAPARSGPLLILGFSDAADSLLDALGESGFDPARATVLVPAARTLGDDVSGPARCRRLDGDPGNPDDVARVVGHTAPAVIFAAAERASQAEAVISGRLARRSTNALIVIEQAAEGPGLADLTPEGATIVSTSGLNAEAVALSLTDPALLVAREAMLGDPGLRLESLTYTGADPLALAEVPVLFGQAGYQPLAVSLSDESSAVLRQGDHILAMYRPEDP